MSEDRSVDTGAPTVHVPAPGPAQSRQVLGAHAVMGRIGAGGMGEVLRVRDPELDRVVAAKVIRGAEGQTQVERFLTEARLTGMLQHPNIVPVHALGTSADGSRFFTMKEVRGRDLSQVIREGTMPRGARLELFLKVCDAIAFAHSRRVIHRDLKPDNVMVGEFGEVLVMDWGIAKVLGGAEPRGAGGGGVGTLDGTIVGTPAYMPPEQAAGRIDEVDERADVYALGALLYHLLSGAPPYDGETSWAILEQVEAGPPPRPSLRGAPVPWELEAIIRKAMAREAGRRYADVGALRADLEAYRDGHVIGAARYSVGQRLGKFLRRHWRSTAAMLGLALFAGMQWRSARALERQRDEARESKRAAQALAKTVAERKRQIHRQWKIAQERLEEIHRLGDASVTMTLYGNADEMLWATPATADGELAHAPTPARLRAVLADIDRWLVEVRAVIARRADTEKAAARDRALTAKVSKTEERNFTGWKARTLEFIVKLTNQLESNWLPQVKGRQAMYRELLEKHRLSEQLWQQAAREIRISPKYDGLRLTPQVGLLPLGPDPLTGLHEFAVFGTGEIVMRRRGQPLALTARSAVVLVLIPGGRHRVGAVKGDRFASPDEHPAAVFELDPFLIARTEMTQWQWRMLTGKTPSSFVYGRQGVTERHPVESVDWTGCVGALAKAGLVLPTEAQWEAAARGGSRAAHVWWTGDDPRSLARAENVGDRALAAANTNLRHSEAWNDGFAIHAPVGSYAARHPYGLFDIAGNVREWCRDAYYRPVYKHPLTRRGLRRVPKDWTSTYRSCRGGSWAYLSQQARSSYRDGYKPTHTEDAVGVRPARLLYDGTTD